MNYFPQQNILLQLVFKLGVVVHICNLSTWEVEAGGS
jgi:hypothetical protein